MYDQDFGAGAPSNPDRDDYLFQLINGNLSLLSGFVLYADQNMPVAKQVFEHASASFQAWRPKRAFYQ